jgi:predicted secreted Zn-dependent protease
MIIWLRGLIVMMSFCVSQVYAAVSIDDQTARYTIEGVTPSDLRREMNSKGPADAGGRRFDGYTRWYVSWRYQYNSTAGRCAIASVTTNLKVTITLPQWGSESRANSAVRQQWARYLGALEQHEQGHRRNGIDAANEIDHAIAAMPPAANCDTLGTKANALGAGILNKFKQRDLDYDRDTRHGATQGARFP